MSIYLQRLSVSLISFLCLLDCSNNPAAPTVGTIQGQIANTVGDTLIAGASISTTPPTSVVNTDAQGRFSINGVSPGQYTVVAFRAGYYSDSITITVTAGQSTTADIRLNLAAPLAPTNLAITPNDSSVTVTWASVNTATSYNLYYAAGTTVTRTRGTKVTGVISPLQVTSLTTGTQYAFAVSAVNAGGESQLSAAIIDSPITISSPVAGEKVVAGDTLLVSWTQSITGHRIFYNYNFGAGWQKFPSVMSVNNYSARAVLPITSYTDSFQIMVEDSGNTYAAGITAPFSIKYIVITNPVAGQTLAAGSTVMITWKDIPAKLSSLRILLSTDGGNSFSDMLTGSIGDLSETSYAWIIGAEPGGSFTYPSSRCIVKIADYIINNCFDVTETFSVQ